MNNIMFICSAGMSTSLLVSKVEQAAAEKGFACKIWASSEAEAKRYYDEVDVILLGPQVRFLLNNAKAATAGKNVKVEVIDMTHYGRLDGSGVLEQIERLLDGQES